MWKFIGIQFHKRQGHKISTSKRYEIQRLGKFQSGGYRIVIHMPTDSPFITHRVTAAVCERLMNGKRKDQSLGQPFGRLVFSFSFLLRDCPYSWTPPQWQGVQSFPQHMKCWVLWELMRLYDWRIITSRPPLSLVFLSCLVADNS